MYGMVEINVQYKDNKKKINMRMRGVIILWFLWYAHDDALGAYI